MNNSTRRNFLRSASILSISIFASRDVLAAIGNQQVALGRSSNLLTSGGQVTEWLSKLFGLPVTSSVDEFGNWTISIDGGAPIPLSFNLAQVQITGTGKVINSLNGSQVYGGASWAPPGLQALFSSSGGTLSSMTDIAYLPNAITNKVGQGQDGTTLRDILGLMTTSMGLAVSQASISANILKLENALAFRKVGYVFGGIDIIGNIVEIVHDKQSAAEMWEDGGQILLGIALLFPLSAPLAIGGTILLTSWELWEYRRTH